MYDKMSWHKQCCVGYLLAFLVIAVITNQSDAADCLNATLTDTTGVFNITYDPSEPICYNFTIANVTGNIFFKMDPSPNLNRSIESISIYNINSTGGLYLVTSKSYKHSLNPVSLPFLSVGYGDNNTVNASVGYGDSNTVNASLIYINLTQPIDNTTSFLGGTYTNDTTGCSMELLTLPNELTVPDYQPGLSTNFTCMYTYEREDELKDVALIFDAFNFSSPASELTLQTSTYNATFQGEELPYDWRLQSKLSVTMKINSKTHDNYTAYFLPIDPVCTRMISVNASGVEMTSPDYPQGEYPNNKDCRPVFVSTDPSKRLMLTMTDIELAQDSDCVEVVDGGASRDITSKLLAYYTALDGYKANDSVMVTSGYAVMVRFKTDELDIAKGYRMFINQTDLGSAYYTPATVGFTTTTDTQAKEIDMLVIAPRDSRVELVPGELTTADGTVICYGGSRRTDSVIASYSAGMYLYPVYSIANSMLCVAKGFKAGDTFTSEANAVTYGFTTLSTTDVGSITRDVVVPFNSTLSWIVQPDAYSGSVIELVIGRLSFSDVTVANLTLSVLSLTNVTYANVTVNTTLPFVVRVPTSTGLRASATVTYLTDKVTSNVMLSASLSYTLDNTTVYPSVPSGIITSPRYPQATPSLTNKTWILTVASLKSYHLSFDPQFELCDGASLSVSTLSSVQVNISGPTMISPADLVVNNTKANETMNMFVSLVSPCHSNTTGVRILYSQIDGGYSSELYDTQLMTSPKYPTPVSATYKSTWVLSVPVNNSAGLLERIQAQITFLPSPYTVLELRDGARYDSPLMMLNTTKADLSVGDNSQTLVTTGNYLYVSYSFDKQDANESGNAFQLLLFANACTNDSQCQLVSNTTVCMPDSWKCDGLYQCKDGKDEMNCGIPTTTLAPAPAVTKEGAKWWVVILCILGGMLLGALISVLCIFVIMRRRGSGYNRLTELMTPVPT